MTRRKPAMKDVSMDCRSSLLKVASVLWGIPIAANLARWQGMRRLWEECGDSWRNAAILGGMRRFRLDNPDVEQRIKAPDYFRLIWLTRVWMKVFSEGFTATDRAKSCSA